MYKFVLWEWTSLPHSVCLIILCLPFHLVSTFVSFSITSKLSSFVIFAKPSTQFWETILNASTIDLTLTPGMCLLVTIQAKSPSSNWSQRPAPWSQHSEDIQVGLTAESPPHAAHPPGGAAARCVVWCSENKGWRWQGAPWACAEVRLTHATDFGTAQWDLMSKVFNISPNKEGILLFGECGGSVLWRAALEKASVGTCPWHLVWDHVATVQNPRKPEGQLSQSVLALLGSRGCEQDRLPLPRQMKWKIRSSWVARMHHKVKGPR